MEPKKGINASLDPIVISGLSGRFPESDNISEFRDQLFDGVDLVTSDERRWPLGAYGAFERSGKLKDIRKFDADFFGIPGKQAERMDPQLRIFLEVVYEAIVDAGFNPKSLRGTRTGVYVGVFETEAADCWLRDPDKMNGYDVLGCLRTMLANRVSFQFDLQGPSVTIDAACSSSLVAMEQAFKDIRAGVCDAAIVGGMHLMLDPVATFKFQTLDGWLCQDGRCKSFDSGANGYVRSEAIAAVFLQKLPSARRVYATIRGTKSNSDGFKEMGATYPHGKLQKQLMLDVLEEFEIDPLSVTYFEAHGTGTKAGDPVELNAIADVYCKDRRSPLLIGSLKSNMGHTEPASGICSIAKIVLIMENGKIPANLHFRNPNPDIPALCDGRLQVVNKNCTWESGLIAMNSFGVGGSNANIILEPNLKRKLVPNPKTSTSIVAISGRTEESTRRALEKIAKSPYDEEHAALLREIHRENINGHPARGFMIIKDQSIVITEAGIPSTEKRPIWLLFSGDASPLLKMGKRMIDLPVFEASIKKSAEILKKHDVDLISLITAESKDAFSISVSSTAIQVALVDVLLTLGIKPDGVVGHDISEITCLYAKESCTAEKALTSSIAQAKNENDFNIQNGESTDKDKKSESSSSALHILTAKSSLDVSHNDSGSSSLLEAAIADIPADAVVIEITSYGVLHDILRRKKVDFTIMSLFEDGHKDQIIAFLKCIGRLYNVGLQPNFEVLHPPIDYPVSRGTAPIAPLVEWNHNIDWPVPSYEDFRRTSSRNIISFDMSDPKSEFFSGHVSDGLNIFPATGYMVLAWKTLAKSKTKEYTDLPVIFKNVKIERPTIMPREGSIKFEISIMDETGDFVISEGGSIVARGKISQKMEADEYSSEPRDSENDGGFFIESYDVYRDLRLRGYDYDGLFRSISKIDNRGEIAVVQWRDEYVAFLDALFQMELFSGQWDDLFAVPTGFRQAIVDPIRHIEHVRNSRIESGVLAVKNSDTGAIKSGGIEIHGISLTQINRRPPRQSSILERYQFIPYVNQKLMSSNKALAVSVQIVLENAPCDEKLKVIELTKLIEETLAKSIIGIVESQPNASIDMNVVTSQTVSSENSQSKSIRFILKDPEKYSGDGRAFLAVGSTPESLPMLQTWVLPGGFILIKDENFKSSRYDSKHNLLLISTQRAIKSVFVLLRKKEEYSIPKMMIHINEKSSNWIDELKSVIAKNEKYIILSDGNHKYSGVMGLANCIRREEEGTNMRMVWLKDHKNRPFSLQNTSYLEQLKKDLVMNVLQDGQFGSYRHTPLEIREDQTVEVEHAYVDMASTGDLSSLRWFEGAPLKPRKSHEELCAVYYAPISYSDVMIAINKSSIDILQTDSVGMNTVFGMDFAGRNEQGKRVMGIANRRGLATMVLADSRLLWEIPKQWTLEQASTIPMVYSMVYYGMILRAGLKHNNSILIHCGSGGIGFAALTLAHSMHCKIFTTVSSDDKRTFLLKHFPALKPENIGNSRDTSFESMVLRETGGLGVDVVLNNSLGSELLEASIRCAKFGGSFVELGNADFPNGTNLATAFFRRNTSFHNIILDHVTTSQEGDNIKMHVHKLVEDGIKSGVVQPIPTTVFDFSEVEDAFRYLSSGLHKGKVVVKVRNEENRSAEFTIEAKMRTYFLQEKSYIIVGGLGGFGLEVGKWMLMRGAKNLVLTSRSGVRTGYQTLTVQRMREKGAQIVISTDDASTMKGAEAILEAATKLGPVGGIFNLAAVLIDKEMPNLSQDDFSAVARPKVEVTRNLDKLSQKMSPELDHFVVFSSVICGRGGPGQANYGWANSVIERICEDRQAQGLPGLAIQWGGVGDTGIVFDLTKGNLSAKVGGTLPQRMNSCLQTLDILLRQPYPILASMTLEQKGDSVAKSEKNILTSIAKILGVNDGQKIDQSIPLIELGLDSLMVTEMRVLLRSYNISLSAQKIRNISIAEVKHMIETTGDRTS